MVASRCFKLNLEEKKFLYKKLMRANKENGCFDEFRKSKHTSSFTQFLTRLKRDETLIHGSLVNVYRTVIVILWQNIHNHYEKIIISETKLGSYCSIMLLMFADSLRGSGYDVFDEIAEYIEAAELEYLMAKLSNDTRIHEVNSFLKTKDVDLASVLRCIMNKHNCLIEKDLYRTVINIFSHLRLIEKK